MFLNLSPDAKLEVMPVPAGEFWMGSDQNDAGTVDDEKPMHLVFVPEYAIGRFPVTIEQYLVFLRANNLPAPALSWPKRMNPVTQVNWFEAQAFCRWVSKLSGRIVRLPSEAEWEKAARGTDGRLWPWGNQAPGAMTTNYRYHTPSALAAGAEAGKDGSINGLTGTSPIGTYYPQSDSPYGCSDMAGNVWEWTLSIYRPYPYKAGDGRETNQDLGMRVVRGGSFLCEAARIRCTSRLRYPPGNRTAPDVGFRVCVET